MSLASVLLAAGVCLSSPLYATDGPPCGDETAECRCSECMDWDATSTATRYEISRETLSTHTVYAVGTVVPQLDADGASQLPTTWCFAHDSVFPHDGTLYRYQTRACNAVGCGGWSVGVQYRGAPYACFEGGREVVCYIGDTLATR